MVAQLHEISSSKNQSSDRQGFSSVLFAISALGTSYMWANTQNGST